MPLDFKKSIPSIVPLYKKSFVPILIHSNFFIGVTLGEITNGPRGGWLLLIGETIKRWR